MKTVSFFAFLVMTLCAAASQKDTEIEALLAHLKALDGAIFVRNGDEHSAVDAESHLRMKWQRGGKRIKTAEDFIEHCASKSSLSGKSYEIRFKDGKVRPAAEVLRNRLKELRSTEGKFVP
jgi:hypothetical protein